MGRSGRLRAMIGRSGASRGDHAPLRRQPVGRWRHRTGIVVLVVLVVGYVGYAGLTSDARVRDQAELFLWGFTGGEVSIGTARFQLFEGIELTDVHVDLPQDDAFGRGEAEDLRRVFTARRVYLRHTPWSLLVGRLGVERVDVDRPVLTIGRREADGRLNWQGLFLGDRRVRDDGRTIRPGVHITDAVVRCASLGPSGRRDIAPIRLNAVAAIDDNQPNVYLAEMRILSPRPGTVDATVDLTTRTFQLKTPLLGIETFAPVLPVAYARWFEILGLRGDIGADQIVHTTTGPSRYEIRLADVALSVPLLQEEFESPADVGSRLLNLSGVSGRLVFEQDTLSLDLAGTLNGSVCSVDGVIRGYRNATASVGLDVRVRSERLVIPAVRDDQQRQQVAKLPRFVSSMFRDFDPSGPMRIDLSVHKEAIVGSKPVITGVMEALGCSTSFRHFPYRLTDMRGIVRYADDGVWVEGLRGRHGSATLVFDGWFEKPRFFAAVKLDIRACNVPMDGELISSLAPRFQAILNRFEPVGLFDATVRMTRGPGSEQAGSQPWQTVAQLDLRDVSARFAALPYPLDRVRGRVAIEPGVIRVRDVVGWRGATRVQVDGVARETGQGQQLDMDLAIHDLPIDEALLAALPTSARRALTEYGASGLCDAAGRVWMVPGVPGVQYDAAVTLRDGQACHQQFPYALSDVGGQVRVTPGRVQIERVEGRHGQGTVRVAGAIDLTGTGTPVPLSIDLVKVALDDDLRQALPEPAQRTWESLQPWGDINARIELVPGQAGQRQWQGELELLGNRFRYEPFPLLLDDVVGRVVVTADRVVLHQVRGRCGEGVVSVEGELGYGQVSRGRLRVAGSDLDFDARLRYALPERLRKAWDGLSPTGRFDVSLSDLSFEPAGDGRRWRYDAAATLHGVNLTAGVSLTDLQGSVRARGEVGPDPGAYSIDGQIALDRMAVGGRVVTHVTGQGVKAADSMLLELTNLSGTMYGGTATGLIELTLGDEAVDYGVAVDMRDVRVTPMVRPDAGSASPSDHEGRIAAHFVLRGRAGSTEDRRGEGEIRMQRAGVSELPLVVALLDAARMRKPGLNRFDQVHGQFYVQGRRLSFSKVELYGPGVALAGAGSMELPSQQLDLRVIAASPDGLERLPVIGELVKGAVRELAEIIVTGTLSDPVFQVQPLRSLQAALNRLFGQPKQMSNER